LRLSAQIWLVPGKTLGAQVENLQKWGAAGMEFGGDVQNPARLAEIKQVLKVSSHKPSAICGAEGPYIVYRR
jgi:hypothetical protein